MFLHVSCVVIGIKFGEKGIKCVCLRVKRMGFDMSERGFARYQLSFDGYQVRFVEYPMSLESCSMGFD